MCLLPVFGLILTSLSLFSLHQRPSIIFYLIIGVHQERFFSSQVRDLLTYLADSKDYAPFKDHVIT